jgi:hypothetical protein
MRKISELRAQSVRNGTDKFTMREIDREIAAARRERRSSEASTRSGT